jgi:hypothetical protein
VAWKQAVPKNADLEVLHTIRRVARACQHLVPLTDLVQDDAIAETQPEQMPANTGNRHPLMKQP